MRHRVQRCWNWRMTTMLISRVFVAGRWLARPVICILRVAWLGKLEAASEEELDMMELAHDRKENSRLGCQIVVTEALDGLTVSLPKKEF